MILTPTESTNSHWHLGQGLGETSRDLRDAIQRFHAHANEPLSLGWKRNLLDQAQEFGDSCSQAGWDGYDASPISSEAVARALLLIDLIPEWAPPPELAPSPEGEISFEWYSGRNKILSVTPQKGLLVYAASLGTDHTRYGKVPVLDSWPSDILSILSEHFCDARLLSSQY